ncbi:MAG: DUF1572 family protein, partial [Planctomycetota bacterium]
RLQLDEALRERAKKGLTAADAPADPRFDYGTVGCVALADVAAAGPDAGGRSVTIRGQPLSVLDALARSVAHVAYHTGQIVLLARTFAGPAWRSLSIPRGGSAAYAANPTRERSPDGR